MRTFGTTVPDLSALRAWLETHGLTHVAMESTGVHWKPVFYVLEVLRYQGIVMRFQGDLRAPRSPATFGRARAPATAPRQVTENT